MSRPTDVTPSVAFTTDWQEDAGRRDFTINALYATADGEIFDYHNGLDDLSAGHVRFIGDARARIREDYLRILRLFRFHAWYGKGEIDAVALHAAAAEKSGLAKLSGERIAKEFLRLLEADNPVPVAARDGGDAAFLPRSCPGRSTSRGSNGSCDRCREFLHARSGARLAALLDAD